MFGPLRCAIAPSLSRSLPLSLSFFSILKLLQSNEFSSASILCLFAQSNQHIMLTLTRTPSPLSLPLSLTLSLAVLSSLLNHKLITFV